MTEIFSFSKLGAYNDCPRRYWYSYIKKIRVPPNEFMKQGIIFHEFADNFFKKMDSDFLERHGVEYLETLKTGDKWQNNFVDFEVKRYNILKSHGLQHLYIPKMTERSLTGEVAGVKIRGIVDRVDERRDGGFEVIDYKPKPPFKDDKLKRQLVLYAELASEVYDIEINHYGAYFYKTSTIWPKDENKGNKIHPASRRALERFITNTVNKIENDDDFYPRYGSLCNYCGYKDKCLSVQINDEDFE